MSSQNEVSAFQIGKSYDYPCTSQVNCHSTEVALIRGRYRIECYGASGGDSSKGKGGFGAYVAGIISLKRKKNFYLFIGAKGHTQLATKSYNGGGRGSLYSSSESVSASGGGSTDIRLVNSNDQAGLLSRIMVAGAGGGAEAYNDGVNGGNAGFFEGEKGIISRKSVLDINQLSEPLGGNSTCGGLRGMCLLDNDKTCSSNLHGHDGSFGFGGDASDYSYGSGGGSGYFGGGGGTVTSGVVTSGAGGSSYVSGKKGSHSFIASNDGTIKESGSIIHSSGLFFTDIRYKNGVDTQYSGNGKVIITYLSDFCSAPNNIMRCRISPILTTNIMILILIS